MKHGGQHWIPSIFNDFFNNELLVRNSATAPAINVFETDKEFKVEVAAAGMCKDDFKISIDNDNDLTITMEKNCNCGCDSKDKDCSTDKNDGKSCSTEKGCSEKEEKEECKGRYIRREFSYTKFQQTLVLPEEFIGKPSRHRYAFGKRKQHMDRNGKSYGIRLHRSRILSLRLRSQLTGSAHLFVPRHLFRTRRRRCRTQYVQKIRTA